MNPHLILLIIEVPPGKARNSDSFLISNESLPDPVHPVDVHPVYVPPLGARNSGNFRISNESSPDPVHHRCSTCLEQEMLTVFRFQMNPHLILLIIAVPPLRARNSDSFPISNESSPDPAHHRVPVARTSGSFQISNESSPDPAHNRPSRSEKF